jgi:hypothetical protein
MFQIHICQLDHEIKRDSNINLLSEVLTKIGKGTPVQYNPEINYELLPGLIPGLTRLEIFNGRK